MSGALIVVLGALKLMTLQNQTYTQDDNYYAMPRFWTSTGLCPAGAIDSKDMQQALLSEAMQMNLRYVAALPSGALTHVRIHWLLGLIQFVAYTQAGVPIYDFTDLDTFIFNLDDLGLYPVIEFMANPGDVFVNNPNQNDFFWENFSYQVTKHYLNNLGATKLLRWRFETWNEPDLRNYNLLNFTSEDYISYIVSLRKGLDVAGRRSTNSLHFELRGPAGLFKAHDKHPLCWGMLKYCNENFAKCPLDVLTYHRKGNGTAEQVLSNSSALLHAIFEQYPKLAAMPLANDEADPIAGWSTARPMQADVRYAATLVAIVLQHWQAMLRQQEFGKLLALGHDNAFLSYHPAEFEQRTLLAHFRMNNSEPVHSQFIQKPVYAALGLLSKLAPLAADLERLAVPTGEQLNLLKTTVVDNAPLYLSWLLLPDATNSNKSRQTMYVERPLPFELCANEMYSFIVEILEQQRTDPAWVWRMYGSPAYPNATVREHMRRSQSPVLHSIGQLKEATLKLNIDFKLPWIILFRVCSNLVPILVAPQQLLATEITRGEVLLTWRETPNKTYCLKTYEVWFKTSTLESNKEQDWLLISKNWHVPFPAFHFAPKDELVNGYYKVRGLDIFGRYGNYSNVLEYIQF